jgi:hypothetical protein
LGEHRAYARKTPDSVNLSIAIFGSDYASANFGDRFFRSSANKRSTAFRYLLETNFGVGANQCGKILDVICESADRQRQRGKPINDERDFLVCSHSGPP